jgi:hypothetical protein
MKTSNIRNPFPELLISVIGILLTISILNKDKPHFSQQNPTYLLIFITLCILGAIATIFPRVCSFELNKNSSLPASRFTHVLGVNIIHGHHMDCTGFTNHEIRIGEKSICAGCLGLLIGSLIAIFITIIQATQRIPMQNQIGFLGIVFVIGGLPYPIVFQKSKPILRITLNTFFVIGFALVYIALSTMSDLGLLGIGLCIYWMYTRIILSNWSHDKICNNCDVLCIEKEGDN